MKKKPTIIALVYDFDGTLCAGNMQEYGLIEALGYTPEEFWRKSDEVSQIHNASGVIAYMKLILDEAKKKGLKLHREDFQEYGKNVELYEGVRDWFQAVNEYGRSQGVQIEHYINSSGLLEVVKGTEIAQEFKHIFASDYIYEDGAAMWPAVAVDYTGKTQYLFKINKGIFNVSDSKKVNESQKDSDKRIPFSHMIYFGDGQTDVPCMKIVKMFGGYSVGVYNPENDRQKKTVRQLLKEDRVNFIAPTVYTRDSKAFEIVCKIIDKVKAETSLKAF